MRKEVNQMSSYVNFYYRTKDDKFISLGDFSRSSYLYKACEGAPYEKLEPFDKTTCKFVKDDLRSWETDAKAAITKLHNDLNNPALYNGLDVPARRQLQLDLESEIEEWTQELDSILYAQNFLGFIEDIHYDEDDYKTYSNETRIYYGIEVGGSLENLQND